MLLTLGFSFMGAALVGSATAYAIQTLLIRRFSLADAGIYQAAYDLSGGARWFRARRYGG